MVTEALAAATDSLLSVEPAKAQAIIEADREIDDLTVEVERIVWQEIEKPRVTRDELRDLVAVLLILPELERSADLAEHVAQRAAAQSRSPDESCKQRTRPTDERGRPRNVAGGG